MQKLPSKELARVVLAAAIALLLFSLWLQARMWLVVAGLMPVAAGGGEFMVALFAGLPTLLLATGLLALAAMKEAWRSWVALVTFRGALVLCAAWLVMFVIR